MDEFLVGWIRKSLAFGKCVDEEIPIIPLGDILYEIRFRCESLDTDIGTLSGIVDDIGIDFLFYVVLGNRYLGFEQEKSDKIYSFNRQGISEFCGEEDLCFRNFLEVHPFGPFFIRIYAGNSCVRKKFLEIFFYFLYPKSDTVKVASMTLRTSMRHFRLGTTVMTEKFGGRRSMDNHREIAAFAEKLVPAVLADESASRSATVEKKEAFLPFCYGFRNLLHEFI